MRFNVSQLMMESSGSSRDFEVDEEFAPDEHDAGARRVKGVVKLLRTDRGIWVSAILDSEALCLCSRCLEAYWQPVHIVIEEEAFPLADPDSGVRMTGVDYADETLGIDEYHMLHITDAVRQYHALSIPMKPVCRRGCPGIRDTRGIDLNESSCHCDKEIRDSRWGPLLESALAKGPTENRKN